MNFKDGYGNTLSIRNLERSKQLNKSMLVQFSIYRIKLSMQLYVTGAAINRLDIARGKKSRSDDVSRVAHLAFDRQKNRYIIFVARSITARSIVVYYRDYSTRSQAWMR